MSGSRKINTACPACVGFSDRIAGLDAEVAALRSEVAALQARLAAAQKNSKNSSKPPSSDITHPGKE